MGCSPSKLQDGAGPVVHPVIKPPTELVKETTPATTTNRSCPEVSAHVGDTEEENEAACKVQSAFRGHAARKRVEEMRSAKDAQVVGAENDDGACAIPEDQAAADRPTCNPDGSAAAVVQIFGEEGANAVAAAFFDGSAATDSGDAACSDAPDQDSTQADDSVPTSAEESAEVPAPQNAPVAGDVVPDEAPAVSPDTGGAEDAVGDGAAPTTVDPVPTEDAPAPESNPADAGALDSDEVSPLAEACDTAEATPTEPVATEDVESPGAAREAEDLVEVAGASTVADPAASNDASAPDAEAAVGGVDHHVEEASEPAEEMVPEESPAPTDDAPTLGEIVEDAGEAATEAADS